MNGNSARHHSDGTVQNLCSLECFFIIFSSSSEPKYFKGFVFSIACYLCITSLEQKQSFIFNSFSAQKRNNRLKNSLCFMCVCASIYICLRARQPCFQIASFREFNLKVKKYFEYQVNIYI